MYAIIETSGKQYKVEEGNVVYTEKQPVAPGEVITFDRVVLLRTDENAIPGKPYVEGAKVTGTVVENVREDKILVVKFGSRKQYRRQKGHKQWLSAVRIDKIEK